MDQKAVVWLLRNPIQATSHKFEVKSLSMVLSFFQTGLVAQVQVWIKWKVVNKWCFRFSHLLLQIACIVKVGDNEKYISSGSSSCILVLLLFLPFKLFLLIVGPVDL